MCQRVTPRRDSAPHTNTRTFTEFDPRRGTCHTAVAELIFEWSKKMNMAARTSAHKLKSSAPCERKDMST